MDRTLELLELTYPLRNGSNFHNISPIILLSPFIIKADDLVSKLNSFNKLIDQIYDEFTGIHRFVPSKGKTSVLVKDKNEINQEIAVFITSFASEINELKQMVNYNDKRSVQSHQSEIISHLLEKLSMFTKRTQRMSKEKDKFNTCPFSFFRNDFSSTSFKMPEFKDSKNSSKNESKVDESSARPVSDAPTLKVLKTKETTSSSATQQSSKVVINYSLAQRYEDEIASTSRFEEYNALAQKHRSVLLREAQDLHHRFTSDMVEANKMEKTVNSLSSMLVEFVTILESQGDMVQFIHGAAGHATELVQQTDEELLLTLSRSRSHSRNMVLLSVGLGLLLLLLDFLTP